MVKHSGNKMTVGIGLDIPYALRQRVKEASPKINMTAVLIAGLEKELKTRDKVRA